MKCAIILAGCGQHDGSETHEVILTLLALEQAGASWHAFAPEMQQPYVVNHCDETRNALEKRSVLEESARLVRGRISPLTTLKVEEFDAIIFPGGFGAVTILCDWLEKKTDFQFTSDLERVIEEARLQEKPMGFICIAPVMILKIYPKATLTIGDDPGIAAWIESMGGTHQQCAADDIVIDVEHKLVSTPANMVAKNMVEVFTGIQKLVSALSVLNPKKIKP